MLMGVFDGHGKYGHEVSKFVSEYIQNNLTSSESVQKSFTDCSSALETELGDKLTKSGTTACVVMKEGDKIICANLGDSKGVLFAHSLEGNTSKVSLNQINFVRCMNCPKSTTLMT